MNDDELSEEMLLHFLDGVESGIAMARQRYKERKGINEPEKEPAAPEISEQPLNTLFYEFGKS